MVGAYTNVSCLRVIRYIADRYESCLTGCRSEDNPWIALRWSLHRPCVSFQVYNVHYTMSINGKLQDGSMEIDAGNNLETFKMGSGAEEAVEVNDFQNVSIFSAFAASHQASLGGRRFGERRHLSHTPTCKVFLAHTVPLIHKHQVADCLCKRTTRYVFIFSK